MRTGGIILAGGTGKRFGGDIPKQFMMLDSQTVLEHSIHRFLSAVDVLVIVVHPDWLSKVKFITKDLSKISIVTGGDTRQLSVWKGLKCLSGKKVDIAAIHDGARPFFSAHLLKQCIEQAIKSGSAIPVLPAASTLALVENGKLSRFLDRSKIFQIQTPQVFRFQTIFDAHTQAFNQGLTHFTDDSQLLEILNLQADTIAGEEDNIKITHPCDLDLAESILKRSSPGGNFK